MIESTASLEPGFSGGPLLDMHGRLVGLNVAMTGRPGSPQCRGYAIPFNDSARQAISELMGQAGEPER
jgi:S1-C subfamily serine protease